MPMVILYNSLNMLKYISQLLSENIDIPDGSQLLNLNALTTPQNNSPTTNLLSNGYHSNQSSGSSAFRHFLGNSNHLSTALFDSEVLNPQNNNNIASYNYNFSSMHNDGSNGYHSSLGSKNIVGNNGSVHSNSLTSNESTMCKLHSQYFSQFCKDCNKVIIICYENNFKKQFFLLVYSTICNYTEF